MGKRNEFSLKLVVLALIATFLSVIPANAAPSAGDVTVTAYSNVAKALTPTDADDTLTGGIIYATGSVTLSAAAPAGTNNLCVGLSGAKAKAAGDGDAGSTVSAYVAATGSQTLMAPNATAIAGLVIEPLAAGTDLVITVGFYDIAASCELPYKCNNR